MKQMHFLRHVVSPIRIQRERLNACLRSAACVLGVAIWTLLVSPARADGDGAATNLQVVQDLYRAFASGSVAEITALMHDDVEWLVAGPTLIPFAGSHCGKSEVDRFFLNAVSQLEVIEQRVDRYIAAENTVAVLIYEHMRVKSTNKEYRTNAVHLYVLENGKISQFEEFVDTAAQAVAFAVSADQLDEVSVPPRRCKES